MKPVLLCPFAAAAFLSLTASVPAFAQDDDAGEVTPATEAAKKKAAPEVRRAATKEEEDAAPEKTDDKELSANELLATAAATMSGMTSYHAEGTITAGKAKASLKGDFAQGAVDMVVKGFDGKTTHRRAIGESFWISEDGKTWKEDAEPGMTATLSSIVTAPIGADMKPWEQGEFKIVGEEKVGEEETLHIQKPAAGDDAAMDFWLAPVEGVGLVVRKASLTVAASDGDFPITFTYTKLNAKMKIEAPATGKAKEE